jgi:hypothetical protein
VADDLTAVLAASKTRFEPWPYDRELPVVHKGGVTLPADEPGALGFKAWSASDGIALPVSSPAGLELGRFVVVPRTPTVGLAWKSKARARALDIAQRYGATLADHLRAEGSPAWPT